MEKLFLLKPLAAHLPSSFSRLNRLILLLWTAGILNDLGYALNFVAIMAKADSLSTGSSAVSIIMILQAVPTLLLGFLGGVLADRFNRKALMLSANLYAAAVVIIITQTDNLLIFGILTALHILGNIVFKPSRDSSIPDLVSKTDLPTANSLFGLNRGLSFFIGSAIAGLIIKTISINACFIFIALFYLSSASVTLLIPHRLFKGRIKGKTDLQGDLKQSISIISQNRILTATLFILASFMVEISIVNPLLPAFVSSFYHRPSAEFGFILSGIGLGGIIGAPFMAILSRKTAITRIIVVAAGIHGLLMLSLISTHIFNAALVLSVVIGFFGVNVNVAGQILLQTEGAGEHLGKVFALNGVLSSVTTVIGLMAGGIIGELLRVEQAWIIAGVFGTSYPLYAAYLMETKA